MAKYSIGMILPSDLEKSQIISYIIDQLSNHGYRVEKNLAFEKVALLNVNYNLKNHTLLIWDSNSTSVSVEDILEIDNHDMILFYTYEGSSLPYTDYNEVYISKNICPVERKKFHDRFLKFSDYTVFYYNFDGSNSSLKYILKANDDSYDNCDNSGCYKCYDLNPIFCIGYFRSYLSKLCPI
jgi:hypothetical protein